MSTGPVNHVGCGGAMEYDFSGNRFICAKCRFYWDGRESGVTEYAPRTDPRWSLYDDE